MGGGGGSFLHLLHPPSAHTWDRLCAGLAFICTSEFPSGSVFLSPSRPQMSPNTSHLELERIEVQAKCNGSIYMPEITSTWGKAGGLPGGGGSLEGQEETL